MRKLITLFLLQLLLCTSTFASGIDSLLHAAENSYSPYHKALNYLNLSKLHEKIDFEKGKEYAHKALFKQNDSIMAEASNQLGRFFFFTSQLDSAQHYFEQAKYYLSEMNDKKRVAVVNISIGAIQLRKADYNSTIKTLTESVSYFEQTGDNLNAAKCYSNMSAAFAELENYQAAIQYNQKALEIFKELNHTQFQLITLPNLAAQHMRSGDTIKAIRYNLEAEKLAIAMNNKRSLSIIYNNLGSAYLDSDETKAKDYLEKTMSLKKELNFKKGIEVIEGNLGYLHLKNKDYKTALTYYKLVTEKVNGKQLAFAYDQLKKCYTGLNQYKTALKFAEKSRQLNDSILSAQNQNVFSEIQTKYETEKKEREIIELEAKNLEVDNKRIRTQNLLFASLVILWLTYILVYFVIRRSKRKERSIRKDLLKKLKEQELNGIDAIIDAQEKERTRIADELHDNLGSRIATMKLYINEITSTPNGEKKTLLDKLNSLAEETYGEVRQIAHKKNSGALITKGLIPSMVVISKQLSETEKLRVQTININVNQRIENTIEIQAFRILQELLTNIIKHAEASEVIIQFSEDNSTLNIMVEDNGKGFDIRTKGDGMGLVNIEKRTERINGNLVIDSSENNGTTVILNIPL